MQRICDMSSVPTSIITTRLDLIRVSTNSVQFRNYAQIKKAAFIAGTSWVSFMTTTVKPHRLKFPDTEVFWGYALGEDALGRIVGKYASWAKLEGVTPHTLRHTFSYNYLEKTGNDLIELATILGHDNVTTTQIYMQKPLGALQEEIEKVQFF
jgi:site-specific recombinase XerD